MERLIWSPLAATLGSYALQAASDLGSSTVAQSSLQQASRCWNCWNPFALHTSKTRGRRLLISQSDNCDRCSGEEKVARPQCDPILLLGKPASTTQERLGLIRWQTLRVSTKRQRLHWSTSSRLRGSRSNESSSCTVARASSIG
jgi:hypothetical protein